MKSARVTIHDIARRAGVGAATVSRVLNGNSNVSEATRARILKVIEELDYRPSFSARQIRTKRSHSIGLITDNIATTPFAGDMIRGAQDAAWEHNTVLLVVDSNGTPSIEAHAVEIMLDRGVDSILYATWFHHVVEVPPRIRDLPTVLMDCFVADQSLPSVVPDEAAAGRMAADILADRGHRRIGFINLREGDVPAAIGRLRGFREELEARGLFDPALYRLATGDNTMGFHGYAEGLELLQLPDRPTAIFCGNDRIAAQVYDAARDLGLRIPHDLAVLGFDNHRIVAEGLTPALSTIQLPHYEMGRWAVRYLLEQRDHPPIQHRVTCPYVSRASV